MLLYHGSNVEVRKPVLHHSRKTLDFGAGFYVTSDFEQARSWALRTARLRGNGRATITSFALSDGDLKSLNVLCFSHANREWLRYVARNRTSRQLVDDYDVVVGPVANDQTIRTVNDYIRGRFSEDIAIQLLLPQKLKDQYAFKTHAALEVLHLEEVIFA